MQQSTKGEPVKLRNSKEYSNKRERESEKDEEKTFFIGNGGNDRCHFRSFLKSFLLGKEFQCVGVEKYILNRISSNEIPLGTAIVPSPRKMNMLLHYTV
jgi:hypothetical protein